MTSYTSTAQRPYSKLYMAFFSGLLVATIGLFTGQYIPPALMVPLMIVEVIMIFMMVMVRKRKAVGYPMMFAFMFISGMTLYPVIADYVSVLGADTVLKAFGITTVSFAGIAIYATVSKKDFTFLGGFLFMGLLVLFVSGIVNIFLPFSHTTDLIYSAFGIFIFVGYTLFDFSRLTHHGFTEKDIPLIVISVYLDFVNLFLYILRFFGLSRD